VIWAILHKFITPVSRRRNAIHIKKLSSSVLYLKYTTDVYCVLHVTTLRVEVLFT